MEFDNRCGFFFLTVGNASRGVDGWADWRAFLKENESRKKRRLIEMRKWRLVQGRWCHKARKLINPSKADMD